MRRATTLLLLASLSITSGCLNVQDREERERFNEKDWKAAVRENNDRLKPEEQRSQGLASGLGAAFKTIGNGLSTVFNYITGNTPFNAAKNLLDPASADLRRKAIVYLSKREYGRQDPYTRYYTEMARSDDDPTVRAMALRALNRSRDADALAVMIQSLEDRSELVRLEAAKALANIPDPSAVEPLVRHMNNAEESADVRIAAADALRNFRTPQAAQALVSVLRDRNFGVSWQARKSLRLITGKDYRYDQAAWLTYLSGNPPQNVG